MGSEPCSSVNSRYKVVMMSSNLQRASTRIVEKDVVTIMTLKRPTLSAIIPGRIRPKIDAALRIGTR